MALTYATFNPSDKGTNITLSGGNIIATSASGTWSSVRSTISKSSGKWYWEYTVTGTGGGNVLLGIGNASATLTNYVGFDANGWGLYTGWNKVNNNVFTAYGTGTMTTGNVIGVALDMDSGTIKFLVNNTDLGVAYSSGITGGIFAMIAVINSNITANFGATTMTYTAPSGFNQGLYSGTLDTPNFFAFF